MANQNEGWASVADSPRTVIDILNEHLSQFTPADPEAFVFSAPEGGPL